MKAGTTSLYRDLAEHPEIFLPADKEPNILIDFSEGKSIEAEYIKLFSGAKAGQLCGEASTNYTKAPKHSGIADTAFSFCGPDLKVIYMRRDPVARIVSQYRHECQHGTIDVSFDEAVRTIPRLIDYSRYDWQIEPWIKCFGSDNILQINLEDYSLNRQAVINNTVSFLGLPVEKMPSINADKISNSAREAKTISSPMLRFIVYSKFYQRGLKSLISDNLRATIRNAILPKPKFEIIEPSTETRDFINRKLNSSPPMI